MAGDGDKGDDAAPHGPPTPDENADHDGTLAPANGDDRGRGQAGADRGPQHAGADPAPTQRDLGDPIATRAHPAPGSGDASDGAAPLPEPLPGSGAGTTATDRIAGAALDAPGTAADPGSAHRPSAAGVGDVLDGRYRLEALLGRGATAEVYRGRDQLLGREIAVKVFHQGVGDHVSVARQRTEMQVLAKLQHPNLVMVYDAKLTDETEPGSSGTPALSYLVMELVPGGTLAGRITPRGLPAAEVARIGAAVAGALAVVHRSGLVHRDIKPANILLSRSGDVKLSDFGIARELEAERLTAAADVIGTAAYLSPEQARGGDVGPPTDMYALGLVLLESLTGRREFPGKAVESAMARLMRDPAVPADLPAPWPALLRAMTQSDPRLRPTAEQVAAALVAPAGTPFVAAAAATATLPQPMPALPTGPPVAAPPPYQPPGRSTGRIVGIAVLIIVLIAAGVVAVVALLRSGGSTPTVPDVTTSPQTSAPSSESVSSSEPRTTASSATSETTPTTPTTATTTATTPTTPPTTATTPTTPSASTPTEPSSPPVTPAPGTAQGNGTGNGTGNGNGQNNGQGNGNGQATGG